MSRILVVDDEPQILRALRINLKARGYDVRTAVDGRHALREAAAFPPDVVILDLGLPDIDGVEVVRGLRGWSRMPIIVLSGRAGTADKVEALDAGADDYVTKPFDINEILARLRAVARRATGPEESASVVIGAYVIDVAAHTVTRKDPAAASGGAPGGPGAGPSEVRLTPTEWALVEALVRHPGKLVSQRQVLSQVWGPGAVSEGHYLREYMARLRRKLETDPARPRHLLTEPGMGVRFAP
jgi:two-component system KDP operon response regulator KdpE